MRFGMTLDVDDARSMERAQLWPGDEDRAFCRCIHGTTCRGFFNARRDRVGYGRQVVMFEKRRGHGPEARPRIVEAESDARALEVKLAAREARNVIGGRRLIVVLGEIAKHWLQVAGGDLVKVKHRQKIDRQG